MVPQPSVGRAFTARRRVRLGDASPSGRLRLDALACYLQDVSNDDTRDAGLLDDMAWVVRRTSLVVRRFPILGDELELVTFCGGTGGRWAERRVAVRERAGAVGSAAAADDAAAIDAATIWVHLDDRQRPSALSAQFVDLYAAAAEGRTVSARLRHGPPDPAAVAGAEPWPVRFTDFDVLGHMNNAAYWSIVEQHLARRRDLRAPLVAEVEFRKGVRPDETVVVAASDWAAGCGLWVLAADGAVRASAQVQTVPGR